MVFITLQPQILLHGINDTILIFIKRMFQYKATKIRYNKKYIVLFSFVIIFCVTLACSQPSGNFNCYVTPPQVAAVAGKGDLIPFSCDQNTKCNCACTNFAAIWTNIETIEFTGWGGKNFTDSTVSCTCECQAQ